MLTSLDRLSFFIHSTTLIRIILCALLSCASLANAISINIIPALKMLMGDEVIHNQEKFKQMLANNHISQAELSQFQDDITKDKQKCLADIQKIINESQRLIGYAQDTILKKDIILILQVYLEFKDTDPYLVKDLIIMLANMHNAICILFFYTQQDFLRTIKQELLQNIHLQAYPKIINMIMDLTPKLEKSSMEKSRNAITQDLHRILCGGMPLLFQHELTV
ncbi:MAG: hypothetical protein HAW62_01740 [Endozoicomonadaceae bacterium]|nr:hypothetical protein [Endozoicomonadaceae bacterium]